MSEPTVESLKDGPNVVRGPLKFVDASGKETVINKQLVALCRCGHSNNMPLCDGTHSKVGFKAAEAKFFQP